MVPHLTDRPLSVIRVRPGQPPFMQKNLPKYTPDWVPFNAGLGGPPEREVTYALANDQRTLIWFANQRAVEYHPALMKVPHWEHQTHLILDLDPPSGRGPRGGVPARRTRGAAHPPGAGQPRAAPAWPRPAGPRGSTSSCRWPRRTPPTYGGDQGHRGGGQRLDRGPGHHGVHRSRSGTARCSWTPPGRAAPRSSPRTARGSGRGCRSRSRCPGTTWTR